MSDGLIFKYRNKLSPHYIPKRLPHREHQINLLHSIYSRMVKDLGNVYPRITQIIGDTGTGKTCTTIRFGKEIADKAKDMGINLKHVYINCKVDGATRFVLFGNLVRKITQKISTRSLSPEEIIRQLVDYLKTEEMFLIVTFDEIDYFIRTNLKEHIIYDLTRIPEMNPGEPCPIIGEIFIARSLKWHEKLEPGELSTLGMGVIEFLRYSNKQVSEILEERVEEAFHPGVVEEDTLKLISNITANPPVNGDIRVGLDLLYYAGTLAENKKSDNILPDHVRKVYSEMNPTITSEDIINLDEKCRMVLLALVRSLRANKSAYVGLRDINESYRVVCEEFSIKPTMMFEEIIQDLIYRGIVDMKSLTEFGISGAPVIDLEKFLGSLNERLRYMNEN